MVFQTSDFLCVGEINELPIFFGMVYFLNFLVPWEFFMLLNETWPITVVSEDRGDFAFLRRQSVKPLQNIAVWVLQDWKWRSLELI